MSVIQNEWRFSHLSFSYFINLFQQCVLCIPQLLVWKINSTESIVQKHTHYKLNVFFSILFSCCFFLHNKVLNAISLCQWVKHDYWKTLSVLFHGNIFPDRFENYSSEIPKNIYHHFMKNIKYLKKKMLNCLAFLSLSNNTFSLLK